MAAGVPTLGGASPFESLVAAGAVVTPQQEFGRGRTPAFQELLDEQLSEGRHEQAAIRAEAEDLKRTRKVLEEGKDG